MIRLFSLSLLALAVALPCAAMAQPPGGGPRGGRGPGGPGGGSPLEMMSKIFDMADANRDGQLTKAELAAAMNQQRGGVQQGRGGPPPERGNEPGNGQDPNQRGLGGPGGHEGGPGGPPPRPGQVLPDFVVQSLNLTERQQKKLAALQSDVDKRLAAMLTDEQKQQLETPPPHAAQGEGGPPHEGPDQNRGNGRPQRPQ